MCTNLIFTRQLTSSQKNDQLSTLAVVSGKKLNIVESRLKIPSVFQKHREKLKTIKFKR